MKRMLSSILSFLMILPCVVFAPVVAESDGDVPLSREELTESLGAEAHGHAEVWPSVQSAQSLPQQHPLSDGTASESHEHTYDYACDPYCNECGEKREVVHAYKSSVCQLCQLPSVLEYTIEDGEVTVTGLRVQLNHLVIPSYVDGYPVKKIGKNAFYRMDKLLTVQLPHGLVSIGDGAFASSRVQSVVIPDTVREIGYGAFYSCQRLTSVVIPEGVENIYDETFYYCISLETVQMPSTLKTIGKLAFCECKALKSIVIPEGVTELPEETFYRCSALTSVQLPSSLKTLGYKSFFECSSLESVSMPSQSLVTIGEAAFCGCSALKSIALPFSLVTIERVAFSDTGLVSIEIPESVTFLGESQFSGSDFLQSVTIRAKIQELGSNTFSSCPLLENVVLPETLVSIAYGAFRGCEKLADIVIPEGVVSIGEHVFANDSALKSIELPSTLTQIGYSAFPNCSALKEIRFHGSKAQWEQITMGDSNPSLAWAAITYHYPRPHLFDHDCDPTCNECDATRETHHNYGDWSSDGEKHWKACSACSHLAEEGPHVFDGESDADCEVCGYERALFVLGDPNGDGSVSFSDIQRIYQHLSTSDKLTGLALTAADANQDGNVTFSDIQRIYQHLSTSNKLF